MQQLVSGPATELHTGPARQALSALATEPDTGPAMPPFPDPTMEP